MPEPTIVDPTASVSPFLLLPVRSLPEFAVELRHRLDRLPAGAERASLAAMLATAEHEVGLRQGIDGGE
jgi:hypothetical protein